MKAAVEAYDALKDWPAPDPRFLNGGTTAAPPFPVGVFGTLENYVTALSTAKGTPTDYLAAALLGGASGAIGAARSVSPRPNWVEPCALWLLPVGAPSSGKTQATQVVQRAIQVIEQEEAPDFQEKLDAHWEKARAAEVALSAWKEIAKKAAKAGRPAPSMPDEAREPPEPQRPRLLVGDATIEAISRLFAYNPRGLYLMRDELAAWLGNFGKYGGDGDAAFYLSTFNGIASPVDRVKAGGSLTPTRALLSVCGGIQPERAQQLMFDGRADDGLVSRFLPFWPDPAPVLWEVQPVDEGRVTAILRRLRSLKMTTNLAGAEAPVVMPLSPAAQEIFAPWWKENKEAARAGSGLLAGFRGKGDGIAARLALVLHLLEWADAGGAEPPAEVSASAVFAAVSLYEDYFVPMAQRLYGDAAMSPAERGAVAVAKELARRRQGQFNARQARREWGLPGLSKPAAMQEALAVLTDADWVKKPEPGMHRHAGRKPEDYLVNPRVFGEAAA